MATTVANTACVNNVEPAKVKIVNTIPDLCDAELGEMFLLISDSHADDKKIHIRVSGGWLKTAALT
jgi:hypothetical protein